MPNTTKAANDGAKAKAGSKRAGPATPSTSGAKSKKQKQQSGSTTTSQKTKKKRGGASTSRAGNIAGTPSSVASGIEFLTPERQKELKSVKMQEKKLTEVEEIETTALAIIGSNSKSTRLNVHRTMWPFAAECKLSADEAEIFLQRYQVNHNCVSPPIASEITNNFLGNPINADRTGKLYDRMMASDTYVLLTSIEKVNVG